MNNSIFDVINWIFKTSTKQPNWENISPYIVNRWISMASNDFCNVINLTSNRWLVKNQNIPYFKFYKQILPKHKRKITYIKKTKFEEMNLENIKDIANNKELSCREIIFLEKQLEQFIEVNK